MAKQVMNSLFKKSLTDLIRGIRSHKENEQGYINECLEEIKQELRSVDKNTKANAIQKLNYVFLHKFSKLSNHLFTINS